MKSLLVALLVIASATVSAAAGRGVVPEHVFEQAAATGSARVIVRLNMPFSPDAEMISDAHGMAQRSDIASTAAAVKAQLKGLRHGIVREYDALPYLALEAGSDALHMLQAMPGLVAEVLEDEIASVEMAQSGPIVQAPQAWTAGFDGTNTIVAVLDTGVLKTHAFLAGKVIAEACFSSNGTNVTSFCPGQATTSVAANSGLNCLATVPGCDHGTHVAGTIAGGTTGVAGSGVAPGARLMAVQVFSKFAQAHASCGVAAGCALSFSSDQLAALNHIFNQRNAFPGRTFASINMSLGGGKVTALCDGAPLQTAIATLKAAGIATVIASGNDGFTDAMSSPGCTPGAISVGSTGDGTAGFTAPLNQVSSFSNSASFLSLLAPGQVINSSIVPSGMGNKQGTSMATPHVAAAFAILRDANPTASVDTLLAALQSTGQAVTDARLVCGSCTSGGITKKLIKINAALALVGVPDVETTAASTVPSASAGQTITVNNTVTNGPLDVGSFAVRFYLSTDTVVDGADVSLGTRTITSMAPGAVSTTAKSVVIPAGTTPGIYRILVFADSANVVAESDETNNVRATAAIVIGRDLTVTMASTVAAANPGQVISVANAAKNTGAVAVGAFTVGFYLSTNATFSAGDVLLGTRNVVSLAAGATSSVPTNVTIPAGTAVGTYFIVVRADNGLTFDEASETNNVRATSAIVVGRDLTVTVATTVASAPPGTSIAVTNAVKNIGSIAVTSFTVRFYLSTNSTFEAGDVSLGTRTIASLAAGATNSTSSTLNIPPATAPGTYRVLVRADSANVIPEASETNNVRATAAIAIAPPCTRAITIGSTLNGALATTDCRSTLRTPDRYMDRYVFSATAGQQVAVVLSSSAFDTYLYLINPDASFLSNDDGFGTGFNSRIPITSGLVTLPATGTYTIEATSFSANDVGSYSVTLTTNPNATSGPSASSPTKESRGRVSQ
jgi:subtilisin family serine protease